MVTFTNSEDPDERPLLVKVKQIFRHRNTIFIRKLLPDTSRCVQIGPSQVYCTCIKPEGIISIKRVEQYMYSAKVQWLQRTRILKILNLNAKRDSSIWFDINFGWFIVYIEGSQVKIL